MAASPLSRAAQSAATMNSGASDAKRGQPLDQQELVDAELFAGRDQPLREGLGRAQDDDGRSKEQARDHQSPAGLGEGGQDPRPRRRTPAPSGVAEQPCGCTGRTDVRSTTESTRLRRLVRGMRKAYTPATAKKPSSTRRRGSKRISEAFPPARREATTNTSTMSGQPRPRSSRLLPVMLAAAILFELRATARDVGEVEVHGILGQHGDEGEHGDRQTGGDIGFGGFGRPGQQERRGHDTRAEHQHRVNGSSSIP